MSSPALSKWWISAVAISALLAAAVLTSTATSTSSTASPQGSTSSPAETATDRLEAAFTRGFATLRCVRRNRRGVGTRAGAVRGVEGRRRPGDR